VTNKDGYGLELPSVLDPPTTVCYKVNVPNDPAYIEAFLGAIYYLGQWVSWQRDPDHKGTIAAQKFKDIFHELKQGNCLPDEIIRAYEEIEDMVSIRQDCDCNSFIKCCDGTEKQIAYTDTVTPPAQPNPGAPQPPANGGSQEYCYHMYANQRLLIPTFVNSGDVITLTSIVGAGNDGTLFGWYCADGRSYAAGTCSGSGHLDGTDPLTTANHMLPILNIAGTYYAFVSGQITVPGGVSNAQIYLQVNDADLTDNSGGYDVCIAVQNNQSGTWSQTFDLAINDGGFFGYAYGGNWVPGSGWEQVLQPPPAASGVGIAIRKSLPATEITRIDLDIVVSAATGAEFWGALLGSTTLWPSSTPLTTTTLTWTGSQVITSGTILDFNPADQNSSCTLTISKVTLYGTGANPF